jgi:hypothetical protein
MNELVETKIRELLIALGNKKVRTTLSEYENGIYDAMEAVFIRDVEAIEDMKQEIEK